MIEIAIPGAKTLRLSTAIIDFNGTLAQDGRLLDGVADRLRTLAASIEIHVATGDTHGNARDVLSELPVQVHIMPSEGQRGAKRTFLGAIGADRVVAIGNGFNDGDLLEHAALSIAVLSGEGGAPETLFAADVAFWTAIEHADPGGVMCTTRKVCVGLVSASR